MTYTLSLLLSLLKPRQASRIFASHKRLPTSYLGHLHFILAVMKRQAGIPNVEVYPAKVIGDSIVRQNSQWRLLG
jgi:hypothetical protein